ncbi:MAG: hypothetical protein Q9160_006274 [Pyrenula sp. 1 TL-2023]
MSMKTVLLAALVAFAEARFGQEHPAAVDEISAVTSGGQPGQAATIAGGSISNLLAAANPCDKLKTGDNILASLGTGDDAVKAAKDFVAAEQNFNQFNQAIPTICSDATLPQNELLRGIVPLVDPAVVGSDVENAMSAQSLQTPFDATGMSVADVMAANGFSNFTTKDAAGTAGAAPAGGAGAAAGAAAASGTGAAAAAASTGSAAASAANSTAATATSADSNACGAPPAAAASSTSTASASDASAAGAADANSTSTGADSSTGTNDSSTSSLAGNDFGLCTPTIKFEGALGGRPATEFTFQAIDSKINAIQQEALNPNIITNRICDELTNQCQANQAAKDTCQQAKAQISALGTRDRATADAWNTALGFAGANTNPDGGATRKMRIVRKF